MSGRPTILVDVDGVCAGFLDGIKNEFDWFEPEQCISYDFSHLDAQRREQIFFLFDRSKFWCELPIMPGAQEGVKELRKLGEVIFVSKPWKACSWWTVARMSWLNRVFGAGTSWEFYTPREDILASLLIDDLPENIDKFKAKQPNSQAILLDAPYNVDSSSSVWHRCHTWPQIIEVTKKLLGRTQAGLTVVLNNADKAKERVENWPEWKQNLTPKPEGMRSNTNKPKMSYMHVEAMKAYARVAAYGEKKYARFNYMKGLSWTETTDSLLRHLMAWLWGKETDDESGLCELDHILWNAAQLVIMRELGIGVDDRYKKEK